MKPQTSNIKHQTSHIETKPPSSWWLALSGIIVLAAVLRLCNLGTFSLWLDEAFTMARVSLPMPELLAEALGDPDNVPLYLVVTYVSLLLGLTDPWLRLVPIAAGLASITVWAVWTRSHFGHRVSLLVAGFMALSTFHIRYSQELRAYPYLLLITGIAMLAADRLRTQPTVKSAFVLAVAVAFGWYTHFSFAMTLVPVIALVLFSFDPSSTPGGSRRRTASLLATSIALGTLAFMPWMAAVAGALPDRFSRGATIWTLGTVGRRWEFLTVGATDLSLLSWLGSLLAILAVIGLIAAAGRRLGRSVVIPAAAMIVVAEFVFLLMNRWSKPRYATAAWPFLVILLVLGLDLVIRRFGNRRLRTIAVLAVALPMLLRADAYHREGRPHWDRMATAIEHTRRPQEPLLFEGDWLAECLPFYYSGEFEKIRWNVDRIENALARSPSVLLVTSIHHANNPEVRRLARRGALVARIPQTGSLVRLRQDMLGPTHDSVNWPVAAADLVPDVLEAPQKGCLSRLIPVSAWRGARSGLTDGILFNQTLPEAVRSGLTGFRTRADGSQFTWVTGPEAAVIMERTRPSPARLSVALRPFRNTSGQELRVVVNGNVLGVRAVKPGPQIAVFSTPASVWRPGRNLVVLQFRHVAASRDGSQLRAAALDWIEVAPLSD